MTDFAKQRPMPTYEYICDACEHELEEFQSITAKPLKKCPACGKPKLRRQIGTGAGIIFKGSGFYETDYRSEGYKSAQKADSDSGKGDGKKADGTSDGKSTGDAGKSDAKAAAKDPKPAGKPANKAAKKPGGGPASK